MTFTPTACIVASCDVCGTDFASDGHTPHFHTQQDAIEGLTELYGWTVDPLPGGGHFLMCAACADGTSDHLDPDCGRDGHRWFGSTSMQICVVCFSTQDNSDHEHDWRYEPIQRVTSKRPARDGGIYGPYRICTICGVGLTLTEAPVNYPELLSAELDPADEEYLAWLDAELWPADAHPRHTRDGLARLEEQEG